jgi:hypothetical protein
MIVLEVLIRKAREIYRTTGVRVPVPVDSETVMQALTLAFFERPVAGREQLRLDIGEFEREQRVNTLLAQWDRAADLEKESRTRFAQHAIRPDEVAAELTVTDGVVGDPHAVRRFFLNAAQRLGLSVQERDGYHVVDPASLWPSIRGHLRWRKPTRVVFEGPVPRSVGEADILDRNHPLIAALSDRILGEAFAPTVDPARRFARCGAAYSTAVGKRTAIVLLRLRYRLETRKGKSLFAEEVVVAGFRGGGGSQEWLETNGDEVVNLLGATPSASISHEERVRQVEWALHALGGAGARLRALAKDRAAEVEASHDRVRKELQGRKLRVVPYDPDILGAYVLVPGGRR